MNDHKTSKTYYLMGAWQQNTRGIFQHNCKQTAIVMEKSSEAAWTDSSHRSFHKCNDGGKSF